MSTLVVDNLPNQERRMATAWFVYNARTATLLSAFNISSVVDFGDGKYVSYFTVPMDDALYSLSSTCGTVSTASNYRNLMVLDDISDGVGARVDRTPYIITDSNYAFRDPDYFSVQFLGGKNL